MSRKRRKHAAAVSPKGRGRSAPARKSGFSALHWGALVVISLLALAAWRASPAAAGRNGTGLAPRAGEPVPELKVKTLDGDRISLAELRGKVVLVNFWATWCPPCRAEMPGFERVWREHQKDGFVVLGLSADEGGSGAVAAFLQERGITYPVAMASSAAKRAFGGVNALPASFLVDKQGVVRRAVTGEFEERLLRQHVSRLLAE